MFSLVNLALRNHFSAEETEERGFALSVLGGHLSYEPYMFTDQKVTICLYDNFENLTLLLRAT